MNCELCGVILNTTESQNGTLCIACCKTHFKQQFSDKNISENDNQLLAKTSNESSVTKRKNDSFKIYYRVVLLIVLIAGLPFSLLLLPRIKNVFSKKQPIFHPECRNIGVKIGKIFLLISECISFLAIATVIGTIILILINASGGLSGVPAALAIVLATVTMYPAVIIIELSQINYWKKQKRKESEGSALDTRKSHQL